MAAILELVKIVCSGPKFFGELSDMSYRGQYPTLYQIWYLYPEGEHISVLQTPLDRLFCEAQYVTSPETPQYVTSPETFLNGSVKIMLYIKSPSPILHCIRLLGESIASQGYWISQNSTIFIMAGWCQWLHFTSLFNYAFTELSHTRYCMATYYL